MKIKKMVKRILAFGVGATMLGATVMGAMAADLKSYPDMFVTDGVFNGLMVVGENAASVDNLALTDIASSMKTKSTGAKSVTVEGDAWKVGTSSKFLELANNNASSSAIVCETVYDMATFIGDEELAALADGTFSTNSANYDYQQFLFFDDNVNKDSNLVKYDENSGDVTGDFFFVKNGREIARYKLEFTSTAESDVTDSDGAASTTGQYLDDFKNTEVTMMGKVYSVVNAERPTAGRTTSVKLTLMSGATTDTVLEGDSKTYKVGDKEYEVSLTYTDATKAKFTVNGESTNKLAVGDTYVLADGSEIGVSEVLYQSYAGGVHSAEFYLGAQKMELRDDNTTVVGGTYNMKVGSQDIDGTTVVLVGTDDATTATLSTIEVNMTAEDDYFVGKGEKLSDVIVAEGEEKEALFGGAFDIEYKGLAEKDTHDLKIKTSSSKRYELEAYDGDGHVVQIPVGYAEAQYNLTFGEETRAGAASRTDNKRLILSEGGTAAGDDAIFKDDYLILTGGNPVDGSAKSYLLQYKGADRSTKTSPKIKFKNQGSGETLEYSVTTLTATGTTATIKLGGYSFLVQNASSQGSDDFSVVVDLNGGGAVAASSNITFVDSYGSRFTFKPVSPNGVGVEGGTAVNQSFMQITQDTPNIDDYDNIVPTSLIINLTAGSSDPEVRADLTGLTLITPSGETEVKYGYTSMGAFVTHSEPSGDPDEITVSYPKEQKLPQLYFTSGATTSVSTAGGELTAVTIVDATKLDSEVASVKAQNLVVVGGPCVNTVAAELMGSPTDCTAGFTPGKAMVKLFEHANGNVAMLVAGYSGADTRLAGKVIAHRWAELSGTEVEVEGTTYSDATISKPAAKVVAAVAEEAAE